MISNNKITLHCYLHQCSLHRSLTILLWLIIIMFIIVDLWEEKRVLLKDVDLKSNFIKKKNRGREGGNE